MKLRFVASRSDPAGMTNAWQVILGCVLMIGQTNLGAVIKEDNRVRKVFTTWRDVNDVQQRRMEISIMKHGQNQYGIGNSRVCGSVEIPVMLPCAVVLATLHVLDVTILCTMVPGGAGETSAQFSQGFAPSRE